MFQISLLDIGIIIFLGFIAFTIKDVISFLKKYVTRKTLLEYYPELVVIMEEAKILAFKKVFQDEILAYSGSGFRLSSEQLKVFQDRYVKLVFDYCGPSVERDLISIYGDYESICLFLVTGFIIKVAESEYEILQAVTQDDEEKLDSLQNPFDMGENDNAAT